VKRLTGPGAETSATIWLEFLYFTGCARFAEWSRAGEGVILKFERVRPPRPGQFQPLQASEIAPRRFESLIRALRRWNYDIIPIGELAERLQRPGRRPRRFACLTFDIGYRDFLDHAWPILKRHSAPVTIYVPGNFADQLGELWWLGLEHVVAHNNRLGLFIDGREHRIDCRRVADKNGAFAFLFETLGTMTPSERSTTIRDLCRRYGSDLSAISAQAVMTWPEIARLAADPLVTVGNAGLTYPVLSRLDVQQSKRELKMGRAVAEAAIGRPAPHLAYPHGTRETFGRRELTLASELGFVSAVTAEPGNVKSGEVEMLALPRIAWDNRRKSLRAFRALLAGFTIRQAATRAIASPAEDPSSI
jgi:peptidoglycan/xylan/chitin deacetylase (PgdA/CDA1 family)